MVRWVEGSGLVLPERAWRLPVVAADSSSGMVGIPIIIFHLLTVTVVSARSAYDWC